MSWKKAEVTLKVVIKINREEAQDIYNYRVDELDPAVIAKQLYVDISDHEVIGPGLMAGDMIQDEVLTIECPVIVQVEDLV